MNHARHIRIAFHTLGCRLNQYDTEMMKSALPGDLRLEVVPWSDPADVYVLNSCTVTLKADHKCRQMVRSIRKRRPDAKIVVTGCYAQTQPDALAAMPELSGVIGVDAAASLGDWLPALLRDERVVAVPNHGRDRVFKDTLIDEFAGRTRAFVKIQDGCDLRCTYCLIWRARGPGRSRSFERIRAQIDRLRSHGYREIVLAGVHLGSYGRDLRPRAALTDILHRILDAYPDLRFRLSSIHPNEVRDALLDVFRSHANMRPYLHVSLQSASDGVLERMNRPYRAATAVDAIARASGLTPGFGIGADVIVGFPGESDAEFEQTRRMIADSPLAYLHVFRYSPRPGTPAAGMTPVHTETVTERSRVLRALSAEKRHAFESALIGTTREAIVETHAAESGWRHATTDNYASIRVPDRWPTGALVNLVPAGFHDGVLYSETIRPVPGHGDGPDTNETGTE